MGTIWMLGTGVNPRADALHPNHRVATAGSAILHRKLWGMLFTAVRLKWGQNWISEMSLVLWKCESWL